jgi:hypothetical protein
VLAWAAELVTSWRLNRQAGSLKTTEQRLRGMVAGDVVGGGTFAAGPQPSGQFGPLLRDVLTELRRDQVTLLVKARDDGLADTYVRHGGVRPDPGPTAPHRVASSRPWPGERTRLASGGRS